jgi:hypothetical protein
MLRYTPNFVSKERGIDQAPAEKTRFMANVPEDTELEPSSMTPAGPLKQNNTRRSRLPFRRSRPQVSGSETSSFAVLQVPQHAVQPLQPAGIHQTNDAYSLATTNQLIDYGQMRSAVTPAAEYFPGRHSRTDIASTIYSSNTNQHSWTEAYEKAASTRDLLKKLTMGQNCDPYVLSDDGLIYAYVPEPDSDLEVSRLVPPEGLIRDRLLDDAKRQLQMGSLANEALAKKMIESLSENYWWDGMHRDISSTVEREDQESSYYTS